LPGLRRAYEEWGYEGGIKEDDVVYVAEANRAIVGLARRTHEHDVTMLRGMQVARSYQRQGIGSSLLRAFTHDIENVVCFCVPYSHLAAFYATAGFTPMRDATAPSFLQGRLRGYRSLGLDVLVMQRPSGRSMEAIC